MTVKFIAACGVAACCLSTPALAQTGPLPTAQPSSQDTTQPSSQEPASDAVLAVPAPQLTPAAPAAAARMLPAGTIVVVTPLEEITSKHLKLGSQFQFQVVNDVVENGFVVIPRGSVATGTITFKTGRAVGGKSGKFDVTFDSVTANGHQFPLSGVHHQEGRGNTVGALLGSILISGRSAVMTQGQMVNALIKAPTPY